MNSFSKQLIDICKHNSVTPTHASILIHLGANVNSKNEETLNTPLHYISSHFVSDKNVAETLLFYGADPNSKNYARQTPLHCACLYMTNDEIVKILIKHECTINSRDERNKTPLHYACEGLYIKYDIVKTLIENKACAMFKDEHGNNPLHCSLDHQDISIDIIQLLLSQDNSIINETNNYGNTPLSIACMSKNPDDEIIKFLVKNGAYLNLESPFGITQYEILKFARPNVYQYLENSKFKKKINFILLIHKFKKENIYSVPKEILLLLISNILPFPDSIFNESTK